MQAIVLGITWLLGGYVIACSAAQIVVSLMTYRIISRGRQFRRAEVAEFLLTGLEPPVSVIVPAYNEEKTIVTSVRSMLQLRYADYEVIVVNDGSRDGTLAELTAAFGLRPFPQAYNARLRTQPVRGVYHSPSHPMLCVIDKENGGGKADANNCGINAARFPLFCCVDADSVLERDSLLRAVQPFIEDPRTVACGGTVRLANGCSVKDGHLLKAGLPGSWLARFQILEYLRGFLFGRMGWSQVNGLLIISGAFGLMHTDTVVEAGGYDPGAVGEDMELVVRMHRVLNRKRRRHRIVYVPEPVCWTEAPEDLATLRSQRTRWQRGLCESLWLNRGMLWAWPPSVAGWIAFPYFVLFEWATPFFETVGYLTLAYVLLMQGVPAKPAVLLLLIAVAFGVLLSCVALLLEEMSFHVYQRKADMLKLFAVALLENIGYRQLNLVWRLAGTWQWLRGKQKAWGAMPRRGIGRAPD
ncbi:MAG TPA: glycosyltransferase [Burkholderiales bacterium]|nr:glycosyltransferase [Burkholderiales bacterium]